MSEPVDWNIINLIVNPEHQYKEVENPPLDNVRMAWPFKTEEELQILSKWFKKEEKKLKKKQVIEHIEKHGKALL